MSILWDEAGGIPDVLRETIERREGFDEVVERLKEPGVRRIIATGNGAAYYVAMSLWLASLGARWPGLVMAVPSGIVADPGFSWRDGDLLLAISSSGEFRDVVAAAKRAEHSVAVTADAGSSLARQASASAIVQVHARQAVTHTQAYCGAVLATLALWADANADPGLRQVLHDVPDAMARELERAPAWADEQLAGLADPRAAVAFGSGAGWAGALEAALLLKEVAGIPAEGVETREGATSAMYGLGMGHLVLSIGPRDDEQLREAEDVCGRTGATVVAIAPAGMSDHRMTPLLSFPGALALATGLAKRAGRDVDDPPWAGAYSLTSRASMSSDGRPS